MMVQAALLEEWVSKYILTLRFTGGKPVPPFWAKFEANVIKILNSDQDELLSGDICQRFYGQNSGSTVLSHEVFFLLFFKNYNSQHPRKLCDPWAGGAYTLI